MRKSLFFLIIVLAGVAVVSVKPAETAVAGQDEKLKILSKPAPSYTRKARSMQLEGVVILRVTFLSTGKIGTIVDQTKEKAEEMRESGLTGNAIKAAKKIKFVPAKQDNVAKTVVRSVEYSFDLY